MSYKLFLAALSVATLLTPVTSHACASGGGHSGHGGNHATTTNGNISLCASFMTMAMDGIRDRADQVPFSELVNAGYEMIPTEMDMSMMMFGIGWAPKDWLELSLGGHFMRSQMFMIHDPLTAPHNSQHNTSGFGDTVVGSNLRVYHDGKNTIKTGLSLSLPTGSIDEGGVHGDSSIHSPYDTQIGTGTYDLLPQISWDMNHGKFSYGLNLGGRIHLGENDNGYSWGDKISGGGKIGYSPREWVKFSTGIDAEHSGKIDGEDPDVTDDMPTGNADFYGGTVINTNMGVDFMFDGGTTSNHSLGANVSVPVYQNYNGYQMNREWAMTIGWISKF